MQLLRYNTYGVLSEIYSRLMDRYGLDNETFNTYKLIDFIITYSGGQYFQFAVEFSGNSNYTFIVQVLMIRLEH